VEGAARSMTAQPIVPGLFEAGTIVGGKYRVLSLIGMGGVGRVYLARHMELDTDVAIKVLQPGMSERPDAVQRFGREARASVRLRSERIARVSDVGWHEGKPYFVMEYLVGCNLLEARQLPGVDIATLCEFFIQACEGLADAHSQGVVHRDVKPENLFVVRDASGWRSLKILDFGISKFSLTGRFSDVDLAGMRTESMMGTPHYISPEQIRATSEVDHRTDLWSLGAVMFEVLADGILPFREEREVTALVAEVLERPHRSLLDFAPNVPERLAAIVDRCLTKDRELRYQSAAEVALDLLPLAPARARASVERAVSVMQVAGLMPLNGDPESLRKMPTLPSERPASTRNAVLAVDEAMALPSSGQRLSTGPAPQSGQPLTLAVPAPRSVRPFSAPPVPAAAPGVPDPAFVAPARAPRRRFTLALLLLSACLGAALLLFSLRSRGPEPSALPPAPEVEPHPIAVADTQLAPTSPEPSAAPSVERPPSAARKASPAPPVQAARPAAVPAPPPAPKPPVTKTADPPPSPPAKLELRRER
jgi:eukaryotic-like serine/threonine-protein kinase